jgi:hypothetical protein
VGELAEGETTAEMSHRERSFVSAGEDMCEESNLQLNLQDEMVDLLDGNDLFLHGHPPEGSSEAEKAEGDSLFEALVNFGREAAAVVSGAGCLLCNLCPVRRAVSIL